MKRLLVTIAILVAFAAPLYAQDVSTTGTFTANAQELVLDLNGHGTVSIQLTGTWAATVQFSATTNGTDYFAIPNVLRVSTQTVVTSTTANDTFIIASAGYVKVKAHTTAFTSGTVNAAMVGSPPVTFPSAISGGAASNVTVVNPSLAVTASALPLPTGAATSANQTNGNQIAQSRTQDSAGNAIGSVLSDNVARGLQIHSGVKSNDSYDIGDPKMPLFPIGGLVDTGGGVFIWSPVRADGATPQVDGTDVGLFVRQVGFPTAAPLADAAPNPTLTKIQTFPMVWDPFSSNTWNRWDGAVRQGVGDQSSRWFVALTDAFNQEAVIQNGEPGDTNYGLTVRQVGLPTAAAPINNTPNPELTKIQSFVMKWDAAGTNWDMWDGSVTVASLPLPTGASTAANQASEIASLASIDAKTPALVGGRQPVDPSGVTSPISAASLPLPTGASTSANQTNGTQLARTTDGTDTAQVETDQKSTGAATGGLVTREAGQSYRATSAALTTNGQRFTVSTRYFNWANAAFTFAQSGGWDGAVKAVYSTDNGATWSTPNSGSQIYDVGGDRAVFELPFDEMSTTPYVVVGGAGVTDYGVELLNTTTGNLTITATANTLPNVVLAKVAGAVAISNIESIVGVSQSGQWSTRTLDGAGNQIESATTAPAGTERGLITRNIPSGTQPISAASLPLPTGAATSANQTNGNQIAQSRTQDGSGNAIASATANPSGTERGLIVRNIPSGSQAVQGTIGINAIELNGETATLLDAHPGPSDWGLIVREASAAYSTGQVTSLADVTLPVSTVNNSTCLVSLELTDQEMDITGTLPNGGAVPLPVINLSTFVQGVGEGITTSGDYLVACAGFESIKIHRVSGSAFDVYATSGKGQPWPGFTQVVQAERASSPAVTSVNDQATSTTCLSSNSNRLGAVVTNDSTSDLYVKFGATASTTSFTYKLFTDQSLTVPFGYTGLISCIWSADSTGAARVTEVVK